MLYPQERERRGMRWVLERAGYYCMIMTGVLILCMIPFFFVWMRLRSQAASEHVFLLPKDRKGKSLMGPFRNF